MEAATSSKAGTGRVACSAIANQQRYYFNCTNSKRIVPQPCSCQTTFSEGGDMPLLLMRAAVTILFHLVAFVGSEIREKSDTSFANTFFSFKNPGVQVFLPDSTTQNHGSVVFNCTAAVPCTVLYPATDTTVYEIHFFYRLHPLYHALPGTTAIVQLEQHFIVWPAEQTLGNKSRSPQGIGHQQWLSACISANINASKL